jgi:nucleoid DNA-binding protein
MIFAANQHLSPTKARINIANKTEAGRVVSAVLDTIRDGLKRGDKVSIYGIEVFETVHRGPPRRSP